MGEMEYGVCDICGCQDVLSRTYYYYNIKCECHSPEHFEIVSTCPRCEPRPPEKTRISIRPISFQSEGSNIQHYYKANINPEHWEYYD